ncbi:hypothetical protein RugamoR1_62860 [Rugamonas sp. R1(2021)]
MKAFASHLAWSEESKQLGLSRDPATLGEKAVWDVDLQRALEEGEGEHGTGIMRPGRLARRHYAGLQADRERQPTGRGYADATRDDWDIRTSTTCAISRHRARPQEIRMPARWASPDKRRIQTGHVTIRLAVSDRGDEWNWRGVHQDDASVERGRQTAS